MLQRWCSLGALTAVTAMLSLPVIAATSGDERSMPPAEVQRDKAQVAERFFGTNEVAHRVSAAPWDASIVETSKAAAPNVSDRTKPLQIGYPRDIPAAARSLPLASLRWQTLADNSRVARVEVLAADAAAVRIGYRIDGPAAGLQLRFAGVGRDEVYASDATPSGELIWSPVLEGESSTLELRIMPGVDTAQMGVTLETLSHLIASPSNMGQKDIRQIGQSGSCNIDVACVSNPSTALLNAAKATAKMVFTTGGSSFLCTGTLLNSTSGSDFFYGAAHCISTQSAASTLNTYWFFDAISCNSTAIPAYQLVTGGATLLVTDLTMDVTLLQLRQAPPTGAVRAAWNATVIPTNTNIIGLHHPSGDLKKFSQGAMQGYGRGPAAYGSEARPQFGKDSFITVRWTNGTTEGGSSGSGVFTFNTAGYYELRGGLEGGAASCSTPTGIDRYSRMDLLYTKLAPYLQPSAVIPTTTSVQASMVEFFNPQSDFYFISSRENEKSLLDGIVDASANHLWFRTGYWFKTDPTPSSLTSSITRYFIPGAAKSGTRGSHFYTALNSDKSAISATGKERFAPCDSVPNGFFCNEGTDSYIASPIKSGNVSDCLPNEQKIYRVFRGAPRYVDDGNHRYVTNADIYNYMVGDLGWTGESVNFCAKP
jgi:hypothetical protein